MDSTPSASIRLRRAADPTTTAPVAPAWSVADIAEARLQLIDMVEDVVVLLLDPTGHVLTWNRAAEKIKGWRAEEVIGRHISMFYTPEAQAVEHPLRELELASMTGMYTEDGWRVRKDGSRFWARVTIHALRNPDGSVLGFGKVTRDLTDDRQKAEQLVNVHRVLEQTIRIDPLTGLSNRRAWDERLTAAMADAERSGYPLAIAMLDLDHFKAYNDEHGHQAGDRLLKRAAIAWRATLRTGDVLARYGGEEFLLALPACPIEDAEILVARLMAATPDGRTFSAGVTLWDGEEDGSRVIDRADRALYDAKDAGRARQHSAWPPRQEIAPR